MRRRARRHKGAIMICAINVKQFEGKTLKAFADIELVRTGIIIRGCALHRKGNREWIVLPACRYEAHDGSTRWSPILELAEGAAVVRRASQEQGVAAVHAFLDQAEAPP
jgi:hypothetical protein